MRIFSRSKGATAVLDLHSSHESAHGSAAAPRPKRHSLFSVQLEVSSRSAAKMLPRLRTKLQVPGQGSILDLDLEKDWGGLTHTPPAMPPATRLLATELHERCLAGLCGGAAGG